MLKDRRSRCIGSEIFYHNFPTDRSRELFKPSKEAEGLLASIKTIRALLGLNFFRCEVTIGEGQRILDNVISA